MKKKSALSVFLLAGCLCLVPGVLGAQNTPPAWVTDLDSSYPDSTYLAAVGTGDNLNLAKQDAFNTLSQRFKMTIKVDTTAQTRYRELTGEKGEKTSTNAKSVDENIQISSGETFRNLKFSDPFTDKKGTVWVVAYLDRSATTQLYVTNIKKDLKVVDEFKTRAANAPSVLTSFALADSAVFISQDADQLVEQLKIISPAAAKQYEDQVNTNALVTLRENYAGKLGYQLVMEDGKDEKIAAAVRSVLSPLKILNRETGPLKIVASLKTEEMAVNPQFKSLAWELSVALTDETGATVASVAKSSRTNGLSIPQAKELAYRDIDKLIKKDLAASLQAYITKISKP